MTPVKIIWCAESKPDFWSRVIMKFMRTRYSHVLILDEEVGKIYHCVDKGVCEEDAAEFFSDHVVIAKKSVALNCSRETFRDCMKWADGQEYSDGQLVAIVVSKLFWFVGFSTMLRLTRRHFRNGKGKGICSEFVGRVLVQFTGYKFDGDLDFDCTPIKLFEDLKPEVYP